MNRVRTIILFFSILSFTLIVNAQEDYDFYLQKARQRLAEGDCTRAEASYNTYKDMAHNTNEEIEQLIEECKTGIPIVNEGDLAFTVNGISFIMKHIEGGAFWMGAQKDNPQGINYDIEAENNESPIHHVTVGSFYMGETEVTQALWKAVMGTNPSYYIGDDFPVDQVNWEDCQSFIRELNLVTGSHFRLPTESEWEYAARGGVSSRGLKYAGGSNIDDVAWYNNNSGRTTHSVKIKSPNELGLYDICGNVLEWCQDWYGNYDRVSQTNPKDSSGGTCHILRGGSLYYGSRMCRLAYRYIMDPTFNGVNYGYGLRLVLSQQ